MGIPLFLLQLLDHATFPTTPLQLRSVARQAEGGDRIAAFLRVLPDSLVLRDRDHGRVAIRKDGSPVWKYSISKRDQSHIREGVLRAAEWLAASGATEVIASTIRPVRWIPGVTSPEAFVADVDAIGYGSNQTGYFSFHQMGSARMGADPLTSAVAANNEVHGTKDLFVMDGSCFPTASGVNPMLTIASIAHRGATLLAERLA